MRSPGATTMAWIRTPACPSARRRTGVYTIAIRDSIYRGREDFVYRLRISAGSGGGPRGSCGSSPERTPAAGPPW